MTDHGVLAQAVEQHRATVLRQVLRRCRDVGFGEVQAYLLCVDYFDRRLQHLKMTSTMQDASHPLGSDLETEAFACMVIAAKFECHGISDSDILRIVPSGLRKAVLAKERRVLSALQHRLWVDTAMTHVPELSTPDGCTSTPDGCFRFNVEMLLIESTLHPRHFAGFPHVVVAGSAVLVALGMMQDTEVHQDIRDAVHEKVWRNTQEHHGHLAQCVQYMSRLLRCLLGKDELSERLARPSANECGVAAVGVCQPQQAVQ